MIRRAAGCRPAEQTSFAAEVARRKGRDDARWRVECAVKVCDGERAGVLWVYESGERRTAEYAAGRCTDSAGCLSLCGRWRSGSAVRQSGREVPQSAQPTAAERWTVSVMPRWERVDHPGVPLDLLAMLHGFGIEQFRPARHAIRRDRHPVTSADTPDFGKQPAALATDDSGGFRQWPRGAVRPGSLSDGFGPGRSRARRLPARRNLCLYSLSGAAHHVPC